MQNNIAVLTGDIVKSSKLPKSDLSRLFEALETGVAELKSWPDAPAIVAFTRFRGDGWQLALGKPEWALRVCLFLRARIRAESKAFETRIGVGIGDAGSIDAGNLSASTGEAFERSGRCLDGLKKRFLLDIDPGPEGNDLLHGVYVLADALSQGWTARQAEVLTHLLHPKPPTQERVAGLVSPAIEQATLAKHFSAAFGVALLEAVASAEAA